MTPEEIRAIVETIGIKDATTVTNENYEYGYSSTQFVLLREIAAQLAEQNIQMREEREMRRVIREEQRAETKKRDEFLARSADGLDAFRKSVESSPVSPRVIFPAAEVVHLGCLVREPDGTLIIAADSGPIRLEPAEAQRILALMNPSVPDAKPQ
jgi:hypothetical protein